MKKASVKLGLGLMVLVLAWGCQPQQAEEPQSLTVYSGRSEALVKPILDRFEAETGIEINLRAGGTSELAVALMEEGDASSADIFWAQDGGALGATHEAGLLMLLPDSLTSKVPARFSNEAGTWVATSGRARTLAYAPARVDVDNLPQSIFDLTDAQYKGRIGWAPTNGSFQAFVTGMRKMVGDERTLEWLTGMRDNEAKAYPRNSAIVQALGDGEVDMGLPNHYYLFRFKNDDPAYPVEQTFFAASDPGNLVNVAGIGILKTTDSPNAALQLASFLLAAEAQGYFTNEANEYPVVEGVAPREGLVPLDDLTNIQPDLDLDALRDLEATLAMLREAELL